MTEEQSPAHGQAETGAAQVQADIERTRQQLGETVQALAAKADVKAQVRHKVADARRQASARTRQVTGDERLQRVARHASRMARSNPESLAAAVAAVVFSCIAIAAWTRRR
jgi:uncharacterized membrane protein